MIPLILDFETYYEKKGYSLKDIPTAQYVRDSRFECLGASAALPTLGVQATWLTPDRLEPFLAALPWSEIQLVAHNCQFDGLVLTERFGHMPKSYACTMFMLRYLIAQGELSSRLGTSLAEAASLVGMEKGDMDAALAAETLDEYATSDGRICEALFLKYWHRLPTTEQDFISLHVRMAAEPVFELDVEALQAMASVDRAKEDLFPRVRKDAMFAAMLQAVNVTPVYKTTAKGQFKLATAKTDEFMQSLHQHTDPRVRLLAEIRAGASSTIHRSRAQRFLACGSPLPVPLLYYGQQPGRASGWDKINMANLPKDSGIRQTLRAPGGQVLIIVDSSQCQVRVDAYLAEEEGLLAEFRAGRDPYIAFAARRYGLPYDEILAGYKDEDARNESGRFTKMRAICKAAVLALGFTQGAGGFLNHCQRFQVPIAGPQEAEQVVEIYRTTYPNIIRFANTCMAEVQRTGRQVLRSGRELIYPDMVIEGREVTYRRPRIFSKLAHEGRTNIWRGIAVENRVMAEERDLISWQTLETPYRCVLMNYDESVFVVRAEEGDEALAVVRQKFSTPPPWLPGLPLKCGVKVSPFYTK